MNQSQTQELRPQVRVINLKHLFFFLLKRWRSLIALILIGAVLGGAYGFYKDSRPEYDPYAEGNEADARQLQELERIYRNYQLVNEDAERNYVVQLPEDVQYYTGTLTAYVDAADDKTTRLMGDLFNVKNDETYLEALAEIVNLGSDMNRSSLAGMLEYQYTVGNNSTTVSIYTADTDGNYGLLTYTVHYATSEQFDRIVAYLKERLNRLDGEYRENYENYTFDLLGVTKAEEDRSVTFQQRRTAAQASVDNLNRFMTILETAEKTTSPYNGASLGKYFRQHVMVSSEKAETGVMKKMLVLGAFGMIVLWGCYWIFVYVVRDRVYTRNAVALEHGLLVLGVAGSDAPKNPIDRFLARLEGRRDFNSAEYLTRSLASLGEAPLILCSLSDEPADKALADTLKEGNADLRVGNVTKDAELLSEAGESPAVVFLVRLGATRNQDLTAAMQVCRLHGYRILGAVLVGE